MQPKKKKKEAEEANEIDGPRNEQAGQLENFEDPVFRGIVLVASAKAGKDFDEHSNL